MFSLMHFRATTRMEQIELEIAGTLQLPLLLSGFAFHHFCRQSHSIVLWCISVCVDNSGNVDSHSAALQASVCNIQCC